ncbi:MAG TPA: hypothetical protein VF841_22080 [Anaeromyxobacter sp.]
MSSRWVNVAMSLLLVFAGLFGRGAEQASDLGVGLTIFLVAFLAMAGVGFRRLNTVLGTWAVLSPFVFAYPDRVPGWTAILAGLVVIVASLWPDRPPARLRAAGPRTA